MPEYFETKSRFLQQQDNGLIKAVTEIHLVDALSFTEAEARIGTELAGCRDLVLVTCKRSKVAEVVERHDGGLWFRVKVTYTTQDEDSDKEKKITLELLVEADDAQEAYEYTQEHLKDMLVPFEIPKVEETKIVSVLHHIGGLRAQMAASAKAENPNANLDAKHNEEEE